MKQVLMIIAVMFVCATSYAQFPQAMNQYNARFIKVSGNDTTNASDSGYVFLGKQLSGLNFTIEVTNTKVSGTPSGKIIYQGSQTSDFAKAYRLKNNSTYTTSIDTAVLANGTTTHLLTVQNCPFSFVRAFKTTDTNTQKSILSGNITYFTNPVVGTR